MVTYSYYYHTLEGGLGSHVSVFVYNTVLTILKRRCRGNSPFERYIICREEIEIETKSPILFFVTLIVMFLEVAYMYIGKYEHCYHTNGIHEYSYIVYHTNGNYEHPYIVTITMVTMTSLHYYHKNINYDHGLVDVSSILLSIMVITLIKYFQTVIQAKLQRK